MRNEEEALVLAAIKGDETPIPMRLDSESNARMSQVELQPSSIRIPIADYAEEEPTENTDGMNSRPVEPNLNDTSPFGRTSLDQVPLMCDGTTPSVERLEIEPQLFRAFDGTDPDYVNATTSDFMRLQLQNVVLTDSNPGKNGRARDEDDTGSASKPETVQQFSHNSLEEIPDMPPQQHQ